MASPAMPGIDLVQVALRTLDVEKKARESGLLKHPPADSTTLDATHQEIQAFFGVRLRDRRDFTEKSLAELKADRQSTANKVDIEQTKHSLASSTNQIIPEVQALKQKHSQRVERAKDEAEASLIYLRGFQQEHNLFHKPAIYPESQVHHFAIVALIAVLEWLSLAVFYAEGSDYGLLGGVLIAMALSVASISLAILLGSLLRYLNHKSIARKLLAGIGAIFLLACFAVVTLGAAHYRVATNEVAAAHATQSANVQSGANSGVRPPTGITSSENEQWRAARLAGQRLVADPLGFEDVFSWILLVLAIVFGIFAAYKGYRIDDPYPGYGERDRSYRHQMRQLESAKEAYVESVRKFFHQTLRGQEALIGQVRRDIDYYLKRCGDSLEVVGAYNNSASSIQEACNIVVQTYRDKNREVAGPPRPGYFVVPVALDSRLFSSIDPLSVEERNLQEKYAGAIREFSELGQQHNQTVQKQLAEELKRLEAQFAVLEANIVDRLRHESAYITGVNR